MLAAPRRKRVFDETRHGHWSRTAWHGSDCSGNRLHGIEVDVTHDALLAARDADIDHPRSRLYVCTTNAVGLTGCRDENVGFAAHFHQVGGATVRQRDRCIDSLSGQQHRQWQTDER